MITPIKPKSTLDCAIDAIRAYILDNRLQPGDVLPTETVLAQKLGISRNILREAMRHYRTLGIIDSKPKLGAAIARLVPDNPYAGYLPFFAAGGNSLRELFEIRSSLEAGAAPFLVRSVTPEGLALLRKIHRQMEVEDHEENFSALDRQFHTELLRMMRNRILDGLLPLIIDFFNELRKQKKLRLRKMTPYRETLSEHRAILDALEKRDAELLAEAIGKHNRIYFKLLNLNESFTGKENYDHTEKKPGPDENACRTESNRL